MLSNAIGIQCNKQQSEQPPKLTFDCHNLDKHIWHEFLKSALILNKISTMSSTPMKAIFSSYWNKYRGEDLKCKENKTDLPLLITILVMSE